MHPRISSKSRVESFITKNLKWPHPVSVTLQAERHGSKTACRPPCVSRAWSKARRAIPRRASHGNVRLG